MAALVAATWLAADGISGPREATAIGALLVVFVAGFAIGIPRLRAGSRELMIGQTSAGLRPIRHSLRLSAGIACLLATPVVVWVSPTQLQWARRAGHVRLLTYETCLIVAIIVTIFVGSRLIASALGGRR
jgi:hypothetical protein